MQFEFLAGWTGPLMGQPSARTSLEAALGLLRQADQLTRDAQQLQLHAAGLAGHAAGILDALKTNSAAVLAAIEAQSETLDRLRSAFSEVGSADTEDAQQVKDMLMAKATEVFGESEAEERVDALVRGDAPLLRTAELIARSATSAQAPFVAAHAAVTATSFRSSCLAAYLFAAAPVDDESMPIEAAATEWLATFALDSEKLVVQRFSALHDALASDAPLDEVGQLLGPTLDEARTRGLMIHQLLGDIARQGIAAEAESTIAPISLSLAESGARLQLLVAYLADALAHSSSLLGNEWRERERAAAQASFASNVPRGTRARIDELPSMADDALVEVEGRIESLGVAADPSHPKFSTFLLLWSFDGSASVRARAHMFNLQRNGLVDGAHCRIRGFVRRERPWILDAEVGLDIDRVSLSKLRKSSWLDDVAYRMRPFFRLYQDEMNLFHTPGGA